MRHPVMLIGLGFLLVAQSVSWGLKGHFEWLHSIGAILGIGAIVGSLYLWKQMGLPSFKAAIPITIFLALITGLWSWKDYRRFKEEMLFQKRCDVAVLSLMNMFPKLTEEEVERKMEEVKRICDQRR